jgi:hypothetical protein
MKQLSALPSPYEALKAMREEKAEAGGSGGPAALPKVGEIQDGHRFKGGNPADPNAWEKVR